MGFYTKDRLAQLGLRHVGRDVQLSDRVSLYNPGNIEIGDYSRIDDFCVLSAGQGGIRVGRNVHIAVFCSLIGSAPIEFHDFSGLASRASVYSSNDDYSGNSMTNPTVSAKYARVSHAPVVVGRHVIVGAGSVLLPGVTMHEGSGAGALSLVNRDCEPFTMYGGVPAKPIGTRARRMLELEREYLAANRPN